MQPSARTVNGWLLPQVPSIGSGRWGRGRPGLRIARAETTDLPGPMVFAPDGRILAIVVSWPFVRLTDVASGLELATLEAPDVDIRIRDPIFQPRRHPS